MKKERIGLFGGTFAPPHLGHVKAVNTVLKHIRLDRLIIMPTAIPPHKVKVKGDTPEQRLEMARAAFGDIPSVEISDYEIKKGGLSYTVNTLEDLCNDKNRIFLICGGDMFRTLDTWYQAERIFKMATIVCMPRCKDELDEMIVKKEEYISKYDAKVRFIGIKPFEISSTEIRRMISQNEDLSRVLPEKVISIVKRDGLYSENLE